MTWCQLNLQEESEDNYWRPWRVYASLEFPQKYSKKALQRNLMLRCKKTGTCRHGEANTYSLSRSPSSWLVIPCDHDSITLALKSESKKSDDLVLKLIVKQEPCLSLRMWFLEICVLQRVWVCVNVQLCLVCVCVESVSMWRVWDGPGIYIHTPLSLATHKPHAPIHTLLFAYGLIKKVLIMVARSPSSRISKINRTDFTLAHTLRDTVGSAVHQIQLSMPLSMYCHVTSMLQLPWSRSHRSQNIYLV